MENIEVMTIWIYGDSWPAGCELDNDHGQDRPNLAFPAIVAKKLSCASINLARTGSSQSYMIEALLDSEIQSNDITIFCLTARTRRMYRDADGKIVEIQFNPNELYSNRYEDDRVCAQNCALLYFLTREKKATPYFLNLFDAVNHNDQMYNLIPDHHWLIPKNHSVLSWIFDPEFFKNHKNHHTGDFTEWLNRNEDPVKKYIRPCIAHPNITGHRAIADFIVDALINKGHFY